MDSRRDENESEAGRSDRPLHPDQEHRQGQQGGRAEQPRDEEGQFAPREGDAAREERSGDRSNPVGAQDDNSASVDESEIDELDDVQERDLDSRSGLAGDSSGNFEQNH